MKLSTQFLLVIFLLPLGLAAQINSETLNINALSTNVSSDGSLEETRTTAGNKSVCYVTELWLASQDSLGPLAVAAQKFRQSGFDFIPGPISTDPNAFTKYNRVWKINKTTIDSFAAGLFLGVVPAAIGNWPAHGNVAFGESYYMAPFVDVNNNGFYSPLYEGDYPCILGDQAIFFVFNDDTTHTTTNAARLGVEILGLAYAYQNGTFLDSVQFVNFTIRAKKQNLPNLQAALFADFDLGNGTDDLMATFIDQNAVIVYNGDSIDQGPLGFGANPPAAGFVVMTGMATFNADGLDNDKDGCIDGVLNANGLCQPVDSSLNRLEYWKLGSSISTNNTSDSISGNPVMPSDYLHYMQGKWRNGAQQFIETPSGFMNNGNGDGYIQSGAGIPTSFAFSGNSYDTSGAFWPSAPANWFESPANMNDKRVVVGMGQTDELPLGKEFQFRIALYLARDTNSANSYDAAYTMAHNINYNLDLNTPVCSGSRLVKIEETELPEFKLYPNPASNFIVIATQNLSQKEALVLNQYGAFVAKIALEDAETTFYVNQLPAGIYFLSIGQKTEKFVVLK